MGVHEHFRNGWRKLCADRAFSAVAILSLGLATGAATACFMLINAMAFQDLPVHAPERLFSLEIKSTQGEARKFSYAMSEELRKELRNRHSVAVELFGSAGLFLSIQWPGGIENTSVICVTPGFFEGLGVNPAIGRAFSSEDMKSGAPPTALIGYDFWRERFGGDPGVIGRTIRVEGAAATIIGVAAPGFTGLEKGVRSSLFMPAATLQRMYPDLPFQSPRFLMFDLMLRLRNDVEVKGLQTVLDVAWPRLLDSFGIKSLSRKVLVRPAHAGTASEMTRQFYPPFLLVLAACGALLLTASINIAGIWLNRLATRRSEIALRLLMGASRRTVAGQLLIEMILLTVIGVAAGAAIAHFGSRFVLAQLITGSLPPYLDLRFDLRVFVFVTAVASLSALVMGLFPAISATGLTIRDVACGRTGTAGRRKGGAINGILISVQVALAVVLLNAAVSIGIGLYRLTIVDLGFEPNGVAFLDCAPMGKTRNSASLDAYRRGVLQSVAQLPGVQSVSYVEWRPLLPSIKETSVSGGREAAPEKAHSAIMNHVMPDLFRTFGIPLVEGRDFSFRDSNSSAKVCIINEVLARRLFRSERPLGQHVRIDRPKGRVEARVIGVVKISKYRSLREPPSPAIYLSYLQFPDPISAPLLAIRTQGNPRQFAGAVARQIRALGVEEPKSFTLLAQILDIHLAQPRLLALIAGALGLIAIVTAALGLYAMASHWLMQRTRELGIMSALGAGPARLGRMIVWHTLLFALAGIVAGIAAILWLRYPLSGWLPGMFEFSRGALLLSGCIAVIAALLAVLVPSHRILSADPMAALRHE